jgi:hypothetical protein
MKVICSVAAICNLIGFIQEAGYGLGFWADPKLNALIICGGLLMAAVAQFEWAFGGRA